MLHRLLNRLILLPDSYCYQVPEDLGLHAEAVAFPNAQGQMLKGLFFSPSGTAASQLRAETPVVLFCPGTASNLSSHLYYVELLCRAGCAVLGFDYTGFGASAGQAWLMTLLSDILCAGDFLRQHTQVERFGVFGVSIGANVALLAATLRSDIAAVAVEGLSLYQDIVDGILAQGIMGPRYVTAVAYDGCLQPSRRHHVVNPRPIGTWLGGFLARAGLAHFPFAGKDPRLPARALTNTPVFCIHGVEDPLLPFEGSLQVYEALPGPKRLWLMPHVSHAQEPILAQDLEYSAQLGDFFHAALRGERTRPTITCEVVQESAATFGVQVRNSGAPGLFLVTCMSEQRLDCHTMWVSQEAYLPALAMPKRPTATCLRLFAVDGEGETARVRQSPRSLCYQSVFQPLIRALSQALHEKRWHDLEPLLPALPSERPEAPFDFFLGLYCIQIMRRTQRRLPHLARIAAEAFQRYWHYGPPSDLAGQGTPWELVTAVLGQPGQSLTTPRVGPQL